MLVEQRQPPGCTKEDRGDGPP